MIEYGPTETSHKNRSCSKEQVRIVCEKYYEENKDKFSYIGDFVEALFAYLRDENYRGNHGMYSLGSVKLIVWEIRKTKTDHLRRKRRVSILREDKPKVMSKYQKEFLIKKSIFEEFIFDEKVTTICLGDVKDRLLQEGLDYSIEHIRSSIFNLVYNLRKQGLTVVTKSLVKSREKYGSLKDRVLREAILEKFLLSDEPIIYFDEVKDRLREVDLEFTDNMCNYYLDKLIIKLQERGVQIVKKMRRTSKEITKKRELRKMLLLGFLRINPNGKFANFYKVIIENNIEDLNKQSLYTEFLNEKNKLLLTK